MKAAEPTLSDLLADLWRAKFYLLIGGIAGLLLGFVFMAASVPHYRASMLVAPAERSSGPDIKALLPDNSSFAVQYMLNAMGSADSGDYIRFEHTLRETSVAAALLKNDRIMKGLSEASRFGFLPSRAPGTSAELASYLHDHIRVEPVGNSPLRRIIYQHPDREFAVYLLRVLHEIADGQIRDEIRGRTESREAYLQQALATTTHPDHRRALTSLLMEQEHVRMILAMDEPFAAIIAEPPAVGARPHWPRAAIIYPVLALGGMMLGFILYGLRRART